MRRLVYAAVLAFICLGLLTSSLSADQLIGVNFQGRNVDGSGNNSNNALAPLSTAGVISQNHWNNDPAQIASQSTHSLSSLMDSTGTATAVSLTVSASDSWSSGSGTGDANHTLLNGIIHFSIGSNQNPTYTFSNLVPGGTYSLVAYTMENGTGGTANLTVGGTTYFTAAQNGPDFNGTFIRALNTNVNGTPDVGNYVQFDNLSADTSGQLTLTEAFRGGSIAFGIAGLQLLQPVPEPASLILFGLGTLALLGKARRRPTA